MAWDRDRRMPGVGTASSSLRDLLHSAVETLTWTHDWVCDLGHNSTVISLKKVYRLLTRQLHSDTGGSRTNWDILEEAKRLLDIA